MLGRQNVVLFCMLGMIAGFLLSRVALSISMFLFIVASLWCSHPREWLKNKWWLAGIAWVVFYALSYFWTANTHEWGIRLQTKLPFFLLPLAFGLMPRLSPKQLAVFTLGSLLMVVAADCYSVSFFLTDPESHIKEYRYSVMLPTLPKEDHVRASMVNTLLIIWVFYVWPMLNGRLVKLLAGLGVLLMAAYLHVLAAKSGLLCLYFFLFSWGVYTAFAKNKIAGIVAIAAIPLLVVAGIRYIPTLRERANYIDFTYFMFRHGDVSGRFGDINRLFSYRVASHIISEHPLTGVGTGDMLVEMEKGYKLLYPQVPDYAVLLPHNQFLVVALGCGLPAALIFVFWVLMPLASVKRNRRGFFFFAIWMVLLFQLMIEPVLEIQLGVFIYLFFLLLQGGELREGGRRPDSLVSL